MAKTDKFNAMIESFECDFDLARKGKRSLANLDKQIENGNERILADIDLLCELSFLLRYGKAEIHIKE